MREFAVWLTTNQHNFIHSFTCEWNWRRSIILRHCTKVKLYLVRNRKRKKSFYTISTGPSFFTHFHLKPELGWLLRNIRYFVFVKCFYSFLNYNRIYYVTIETNHQCEVLKMICFLNCRGNLSFQIFREIKTFFSTSISKTVVANLAIKKTNHF